MCLANHEKSGLLIHEINEKGPFLNFRYNQPYQAKLLMRNIFSLKRKQDFTQMCLRLHVLDGCAWDPRSQIPQILEVCIGQPFLGKTYAIKKEEK